MTIAFVRTASRHRPARKTFPPRFVFQCVVLFSVVWMHAAESQGDETSPPDRVALLTRDALPILEQYCYGCHADGAEEGNFAMDDYPSTEAMLSDSQMWWTVLKNVRADVMPPHGEDRPTHEEKRQLFKTVTEIVFGADADNPDPGRLPLRRLNRLEYRNTIQDLMGIDFDTTVEFPPDDSGDGFDNNADALSISPLLAERYLDAARTIVDQAVPQQSRVIPVQPIRPDDFRSDEGANARDLSLDQASTSVAGFEIETDSSYRVVIPIEVEGSFNFNPSQATIRVSLDDEVVFEKAYAWQASKTDVLRYERDLKPGTHRLRIEVVPAEEQPDVEIEPGTFVKARLSTVQLEGPLDKSYWNKPEGYDRFFHRDAPPEQPAAQVDYAHELLSRFCARAFRRPVDEAYVDRLLNLVGFSEAELTGDASDDDALTFEQRVGRAMTVVLASPRFLFRLDSPDPTSEDPFPMIDEYSLASRLSYFLWSTMPDATLLELAEQGQLRSNLEDQIRRMMRDERSSRFIRNFVGQWLQTRDVEGTSIDPLAALGLRKEYEQIREYLESTPSGRRQPPDDASQEHLAAYRRYREIRDQRGRLDGEVRRDMASETNRFFEHVLREDRPLVELIDSDYAFLNERLAKHYGVADVDGDRLRQVTLPDESPLGGVLTQGTFLIVTSNPTRTSPVKRGLFILDNILGTPAPPAPASVPELEESAEKSQSENASLRELLELHRSEPLCSACHSRFDPLGLAFENFSAIGTWRELDEGKPINAAGELISGESFRDVNQLKQILANERRSDFYRCLSERMLSYAIGRGLEHEDEVVLEQVTRELIEHDGRALSLVEGVIRSAAFQRMRPRQGTR